MCLGALFCFPAGASTGRGESAKYDIIYAVLGALGGALLELGLRLFEKPKRQFTIPNLQFRIGTLLVATTFVAVVLGIVVWVMRT
jgi:hypothetical protein